MASPVRLRFLAYLLTSSHIREGSRRSASIAILGSNLKQGKPRPQTLKLEFYSRVFVDDLVALAGAKPVGRGGGGTQR